MKFYSRNIVEKVRKMKSDGLAVKEITQKTGIQKNAILRWCFDIKSNNKNHLRYSNIIKKIKEGSAKSFDKFFLNKKNAKILTSLIYWCEGYGYPGCNCVGFANSDINLVKTFLYLFRKGFCPKEEKFRVHLQMHTTHNKNEIFSFWSDLLNIPKNQFYKPTVTKPMEKRKRIGYKGTCTIKYYDSSIYNEIIGIYENFFNSFIK